MLPDAIAALVAREFAPEERERATVLLAEYGTASWHRECERVQRAIIALARGRLVELERLVAHALRDYRDVLMWAEYQHDPETGQPAIRRLGESGK